MCVLIYLLIVVLLGLILLRRGRPVLCNNSSARCSQTLHIVKLIMLLVERACLQGCVLLLWGPILAASVVGWLLQLVEHRMHAIGDLELLR